MEDVAHQRPMLSSSVPEAALPRLDYDAQVPRERTFEYVSASPCVHSDPVGSAEAPVLEPLPAYWKVVDSVKDLEYVPPDDAVDRDLMCGVCLSWPVDPVVLGCPGGHMFCRGCVPGRLCPLDRQAFATITPPQRPIVSLLNRLQVRCPHSELGCGWCGPRGNVADHSVHCIFAEQECVHCGLRLRRDACAAHVHYGSPVPPCERGASNSEVEVALVPGQNNTAERRQEQIMRIIEVYEHAERLNACFVVDCTGSMGRHIQAVKNQIGGIVQEMQARLPSMCLHLSFVGYRDHCDGIRFELLPFTTSVDEFRAFVSRVRATGGGGDGPEDVHGALQQACALDWSSGGAITRVLIHIADYPAHGRRYNDQERDNYPNGDPYGLDLEDLMRQLQALNVQYVFGHVTEHTHKMVRLVNEELDGYIESKDMNDVALVTEAVTASLASSVASTVSTLTSRLGGRDADEPTVLSSALPDWNAVAPQPVRIRKVQRVCDISLLYAEADPNATRSITESSAYVQLAPLPFAEGESRVARHAICDDLPAVAKHLKKAEDTEEDAGEGGLSVLHGDCEVQIELGEVSAVAAFLAELFSAKQPEGERVAFLASDIADGPSVVPFNLEGELPVGDFLRFSNNIGWWEPDAPTALMKFARWSHTVTKGHMMIVDLQGVPTAEGWLLTDPCILCEDVTRFGAGNLGPHAISRCLTALAHRLDPVPSSPSVADVTPPPNAWASSTRTRSAGIPAGSFDAFSAGSLDVDCMLDKLLGAKASGSTRVQLEENQIRMLLSSARDTFLRQPTLVELEAPVKIVGDTHGQFHDLLRLFELGGVPPDVKYLFLGDYVDRGKQSIETMCLLLAYKAKYPQGMFTLRGNHECASINRIYGFYDECKRRYNIKLWKLFCDVFNCLPPAALISNNIFCMHGGLSPELMHFDQIQNIIRPSDVPDTGLLCDLLWADPDKDVLGWVENDRGVSYTYGADVLTNFNRRMGVDLVVRAHQVVEDGYEFFANRQLVTLFSAPNYCGEFDNAAALMEVNEAFVCSFRILKPETKRRTGWFS